MSDAGPGMGDAVPPEAQPADASWFGHPAGLSTLFFTEMWERFSFYGMRALLTLFMTAPVALGGLGWSAAKAGPIYGLYTAMVYVTALPGGWIADRLLGQRRSVLLGAVVIMCGHISLMFHGLFAFYLGLVLIIIGTGLLKPNISAMVGQLYGEQDVRRDAGFSLFYMGINVGAFFSPLVCGYLAQDPAFGEILQGLGLDPVNSWHWGFGAAAVGMGLGIVQYVLGSRGLGRAFQWLAIAALLGFMVFIVVTKLSYEEPAPAAIPPGIEAPLPADIAASETPPEVTSPVLLTALIAGILVVLAHTALLIRRRQVIFGLVGLVLSAALYFSHPERIAEDASVVLMLVKAVGMLLLIFPYVYFSWLFLDREWTATERKRLYAIPVFFLGAAVFWSAFEQAGTTLNLFADRFTNNVVLGLAYPSSWFQSVNAALIVLLAPLFAWLWVRLARRGAEPSSPAKFAAGLFLLGLGFAVLAAGAVLSGEEGARVSPMWLFTVYLLHTLGELCLSPVGLSTMTKLAPARVAGQMMGVWFLGAATGNFIGGLVAGLFEELPLPLLFGAIFGFTMLATLAMIVVVRPVRRLMGGVH